MRFVRMLIVLALIASIAINGILYLKTRKRPIIKVNGEGLSRRDLDDYLEQQAGPTAKANLVLRMLLAQEAKKQGVAPTDQEVDQAFQELKEVNWRYAYEAGTNPWKATELKNAIRQELAAGRLLYKDVPITDDEIKTEYNTNPAAYDTPNKAKCYLAVLTDKAPKDEIKQLLEKKDPPVPPSSILQQYRVGVRFFGDNDKYTLQQPFGNTNINKAVFDMKPGDVKELPAQGEFAQMGGKTILLRMLEIIPGKKADLNDPKTKEKIRNALAKQRSKPIKEYLNTLWAKTDLWFEEGNDKKYIEAILFPEQARAEASK